MTAKLFLLRVPTRWPETAPKMVQKKKKPEETGGSVAVRTGFLRVSRRREPQCVRCPSARVRADSGKQE